MDTANTTATMPETTAATRVLRPSLPSSDHSARTAPASKEGAFSGPLSVWCSIRLDTQVHQAHVIVPNAPIVAICAHVDMAKEWPAPPDSRHSKNRARRPAAPGGPADKRRPGGPGEG